MPLTGEQIKLVRGWVDEAGYAADTEWSEKVGPPVSPEDMAFEIAYVIINSGMRWTVAQGIWGRVRPALETVGRIEPEHFGHPGKRSAINDVWRRRADLFVACRRVLDLGPERALAWCLDLPWIGGITKYHLAKNFGVDVAKPDIWLERVSKVVGEDVQALCRRLGQESGLRAATVDLILWRACTERILIFDDGMLMPNAVGRWESWLAAGAYPQSSPEAVR